VRKLPDAARRGWTTDEEENERDIFCFGAPILDRRGHAVAAASISAFRGSACVRWLSKSTLRRCSRPPPTSRAFSVTDPICRAQRQKLLWLLDSFEDLTIREIGQCLLSD
jgi:hypothetical protein